MLPADLIKPRLRQRNGELYIQMLESSTSRWQKTAAELIALFQQHTGKSQANWTDTVEQYEGDRIDYVVIRGLAKVLTDNATFTPIETPISLGRITRAFVQ